MQGALEVKAISRLATQRGAEWKPLHTAVMGCLLAHRNRGTGHCWPDRRTIAKYCNVSERTVDRTLSQLVAWGAIEKQQPKAMAGGHFRPRQFTFLFSLPVGQSCVSRPRDKAVSHGRETKSGSTVRQNGMRNKEEEKDLKQEKDQRHQSAARNANVVRFRKHPGGGVGTPYANDGRSGRPDGPVSWDPAQPAQSGVAAVSRAGGNVLVRAFPASGRARDLQSRHRGRSTGNRDRQILF